MREENWKDLWQQSCHTEGKLGLVTTKMAAIQEIASQKIPKTIYGCKVESHESTRQRVEHSLPKNHEDHIAGK